MNRIEARATPLDESTIAEPTARRTFWRVRILAGLVALAIAWTLFWFAGSQVALGRLDEWSAREAEAGRRWSCPARRLEGFPFQARIVCEAPSYAGPLEGVELRAQFASLSVEAGLAHAGRVDAVFAGPLVVETRENDTALTLAFAALKLELRFSEAKLEEALLSGDELKIGWRDVRASFDAAAKRVKISARPEANARNALAFDLETIGATLPALDIFAGSRDSAALHAKLTLSDASFFAARSFADRLERWRAANGRLTIEGFALAKGALEISAAGELGVDEYHRLEGRLDIAEKGGDSLLSNLGAPRRTIDAMRTVGKLLRGSDADGDRPTTLPLSFRDGWISIGPLRVARSLEPLY